MPAHTNEINQLSAKESWRMFRIMAEIVEGFDTLGGLPPCISVFGSARTPAQNPYYKITEKLASELVKKGFGIITGGGPGIMEAANKGATEANGISIGLQIDLPHEQSTNPFVKTELSFRYFFIRKLMFIKYSQAYIVMPGGMGTVDELSEAFVLMQTHKIKPFPLIFYGSKFWSGFIDWLKTSMIQDNYLTEKELELIHICDSIEEVLAVLDKNPIIEKP